MRFRPPTVRIALSCALVLVPLALRAQTSVPVLSQSIPAQGLAPGGPAVTIDLRNYFAVSGVAANAVVVQFETALGRFNVELRPDAAPRHVGNFLTYVQAGAYTNTFFHRAATFEGGPISIVQGGGYRTPLAQPPHAVPRFAPVELEYNLPNARGTLAAARTSDPHSATSEWFINVRDNSALLGPANGGGYSVFGHVLGTGMDVVDAIAALPRTSASSFSELPVRNYTGGNVTDAHLAIVNAINTATLFPTGGGASVVEFAVENSAPGVVSTVLSGSTLTLTPAAPGSATLTIRASDANGNSATGAFDVSVAGTAPVFTAQPRAQTVATGSTVVFSAPAIGAGEFRWERNGVTIPGATTSTLVIAQATSADSATYTVFASNALGVTTSDSATLTVIDVPAESTGRLINLSILTSAGSGDNLLTVGAVIGPLDSSESLPLVVRAVGPTLAMDPYNVLGTLPDPVMTLFAAGNTSPLDTNDDWGGSATLAAAFESVGAFALPTASLDSAIVRPAPGVGVGGYTVQVTGKGDGSGFVIAEIYDASGATRTAATPRLINVSSLARVEPGADLAVGFVIGGQTARTVLVRGVGPSLAQFGVDGVIGDPRLELFDNNTRQRIGINDDWAGALEVSAAADQVGGFPLGGGTSKDAAMLVTLPPGPYSARVAGAGGAGGMVIVEVYEVR